jgi:hypothetical protein
MRKNNSKVAYEIGQAIETLRKHGVIVTLDTPDSRKLWACSREETAKRCGMSVDWVKAHMEEFPNWMRMKGGDIRIPLEDVEKAWERYREGRDRHAITIKRTGPSNLSISLGNRQDDLLAIQQPV